MILAIALTSLLASPVQSLPQSQVLESNAQDLEIANVLLQNPKAYADLRRCGQAQIESASIEADRSGQTKKYVLRGSHLAGDIIQGTFTLSIEALVKDPELNWVVYSHSLQLDHEKYSKCGSR